MKNPAPFNLPQTIASTLSLFVSGGTLICCALPALMVSLGMGAALAVLVSDFPALIWLSRHKGLVFFLSAAMIVLAGVMLWRARNFPCPADPVKARACTRLRRVSWWIWGLSVLFFSTGAFFAFLAPTILSK
jgi:hypothetical protein